MNRNHPGTKFSLPASLLHIRCDSSTFNCTLASWHYCQNVTFSPHRCCSRSAFACDK